MEVVALNDDVYFNAVVLMDEDGKLHMYNPIPEDIVRRCSPTAEAVALSPIQ